MSAIYFFEILVCHWLFGFIVCIWTWFGCSFSDKLMFPRLYADKNYFCNDVTVGLLIVWFWFAFLWPAVFVYGLICWVFGSIIFIAKIPKFMQFDTKRVLFNPCDLFRKKPDHD